MLDDKTAGSLTAGSHQHIETEAALHASDVFLPDSEGFTFT